MQQEVYSKVYDLISKGDLGSLEIIEQYGTQQFLAGQEAGKREAEWSDEKKREFAYKVWIASANSFRLYPNNKHTFSDFYSSFAPESIEAEESNLKEK